MHISLDAALQRQPLLSTVGDKLLPTFPGAAAAYSLRALNGDANDVVRVRRSGDDEERDFTAEGVALELEDWVNGKLETTLPCDHITTIEVSGINTGSDGADGTYTLTAPLRWDGPNGHVIIRNTGDSLDPYEANTRWLLVDADDLFVAIFSDPCDESVLPFDATWSTGTFTNPNAAAAAYSLRKVRNDYTGNAVQIRRASDNVEVNVAFDSNDEVSASSAISNVTESPDRGDTTATTLGEFLTEESSMTKDAEDGSTSGFSTSDFVSSSTISVTSSNPISGTKSYLMSHTGTAGSAGYPRLDVPRSSGFVFALNKEYRVQFKIKLISGTTSIFGIRFGQSGSGANASPASVNLTLGQVIEYDGIINATSIGGNQILNLQFDGTDGDFEVLVDDIKITANEYDCTVVTWYDQSGNGNDATQLTTGSQPKIAENGSLLADGISFETAQTHHLKVTGTSDETLHTFAVYNARTASPEFGHVFDASASGSGASSQLYSIYTGAGNNQTIFRFRDSGGSKTITKTSTDGSKNLATALFDGSTNIGYFGIDGETPSSIAGVSDRETSNLWGIGASYNAFTGRSFDGTISELIIYSSDQSDNRFKIESNINNHYQLDGYKVHYEYDLTSGDGGFNVANGCAITTNQTVGGRGECLKATSTVGSGFNLIKDTAYPSAIGSYMIEGEIYIDPSNASLKQVRFGLDSSSGRGYIPTTVTETGWSTFRFSFNTASVADDFQVIGEDADGNASFTRTAGDVFAIRNVKSKFAEDGFVETWYDQSGNDRHAKQDAVEGYQPQIVKAGSLLADGIDFDGTNHKLDIDGYAALSLVYSSFVVASLDEAAASSIKTIFDSSDTANGGFAIVHGNTANKFTPFWFDGDDTVVNVFGSGSNLTSTEALYSTIMKTGASTVHIDGTLDQTLTNTWTLAGSNNFSKSTIGYDQSTPSREFNGKIQEIIIYESDQSANRPAIESNIADEYGITLS